jgi:hypothetical protein
MVLRKLPEAGHTTSQAAENIYGHNSRQQDHGKALIDIQAATAKVASENTMSSGSPFVNLAPVLSTNCQLLSKMVSTSAKTAVKNGTSTVITNSPSPVMEPTESINSSLIARSFINTAQTELGLSTVNNLPSSSFAVESLLPPTPYEEDLEATRSVTTNTNPAAVSKHTKYAVLISMMNLS